MTGNCEHCNKSFSCEIFHCGFADSSYAYCERCGTTAMLSGWSKQWPQGVKCTQGEITKEMEPFLSSCECGGSFRKGSSPRCPYCKEPVSAVWAADYIERQSPGTLQGWRWQRNWAEIYCIVIDKRCVRDNFKPVRQSPVDS